MLQSILGKGHRRQVEAVTFRRPGVLMKGVAIVSPAQNADAKCLRGCGGNVHNW
jgi:hypothetical protein